MKTKYLRKLHLTSKDFCFCDEIPNGAKRLRMNIIDLPSHERNRISGIKKVNELKMLFKYF